MPFQGERASYAPLRRIAESEKIRSLQKRFRIADTSEAIAEALKVIAQSPSTNSDKHEPKYIIAVDGGRQSVDVETGYPGAEVGYITIAAVLILLDKLREVAAQDIINPIEYRKTQKQSSIDTALPGRGVLIDNEKDPESSMRRTLFEEMSKYRVFPDSETLLETYEALMQAAPNERAVVCPCDRREQYHRNIGEYTCTACGDSLFSIDAMRIHELFSPHESCEKMFGHVMTMLERMWLIHVLRAFERRGDEWLDLIGKMAFLMDGPLAMYGTPAWLSTPIRGELRRLNEAQKLLTGVDMLILGLEKSGNFARHFEMIDSNKDGSFCFSPGQYLLLNDEYIRNHIVPSVEKRQYGRNTYFGRKMLYKSSLGHRLVINVACFTDEQFNLETANSNQFPRLFDSLELLDKISSNLYPNSLSPLVAAHAEAAIPLHLGQNILEDIAKQVVSND